jgi:chemotaxis family two-component system response regulator Rcp1
MLADGNPGDVRLIQDILFSADMGVRVIVALNSVEVTEMLGLRGVYAETPVPDFILLDLGLSKMDAREVLAYLKSDKILESIPVIILTAAQATQDILKSYELQSRDFLKAQQWSVYQQLWKSIDEFWLKSASFPAQHQSIFPSQVS